MDAATIRATCPNCHAALRIPAAWAGQVVKCKKCGSGVRTRPQDGVAEHPLSLDDAEQNGHAANGSPFEELRKAGPASRENPFDSGDEQAPQQPSYQPNGSYPGVPPGYPYPMPPGYGPPPGYPYPMPPGYAPPPGYPYPMPPGYAPPPGYPYAMPPGYPPPAAYEPPPAPTFQPSVSPPPPTGPSAAAVAVAAHAGFKPSEALGAHSRRGGYYRRGSDKSKFIWISVALFLTAGLVVGGIYGAKSLTRKPGTEPTGHNGPLEPKPGGPGISGPKGPGLLANSGNFPRRLLFIHVSNYLYLNPLTHAQVDGKIHGPDLTKPAANRLASEWRVPNDQVFLLSDTASGPDLRSPMREVITGTYEKFFDSSRAQDRIVVYFGGHVLTKEGKTYIVPIEGDPDEPEKLIPLDAFYAKMKDCKATQKVVIWDVCRYNPERGRNRPGSEPMTEETAKALGTPPAGVQALITCQPGENALEFYNAQPDGFGKGKLPVIGSNFLAAVRYVSDKNRNNAKQQNPEDALPVNDWATTLGQRAAEVVAVEGKGKQTLKAAGAAPATLVAFNKEEPAAAKFDFPPSPKSASPAEVGEIATELNLPGIKKDDSESGVGQFPFPAEALAPYKADVSIAEIKANKDKYGFRIAVLDAYDTIRDVWNGGEGAGMSIREELRGKTNDMLKKEVLAEQLFPARGISKLDRAITLLEAVEGMREAEPKRWQAHYDYALAQCKARLAWMHEYDLALGSIRTDVLPPLDEKKGQDGYRLVSSEKMKVKKEAKIAEEAKALYEKIITDYKGSPWAILAKRDRTQSLGLSWQAASFGTPEPPP